MEQSIKKTFKIIKTCVGSIRFMIESAEHQLREVYLDDNRKFINLPEDWAVGVFRNPGAYNCYKLGYFTFENPEEIARIAAEQGEYFEDTTLLPKKQTYLQDILEILKTSKRSEIEALCNSENEQTIVAIVKENHDQLTRGTIKYVSELLNVELNFDELD